MEEIIIIGAGAIGRGFLPWILEDNYRLVFVDSNPEITLKLQEAKQYTTYRVSDKKLDSKVVPVHQAHFPADFQKVKYPNAKAIFICAGPRSCPGAAHIVKGYDCPIIVCENDPAVVDTIKNVLGINNVHFAIPDVITSNTAPPHLLSLDILSVVTENGTLFLDEEVRDLKGSFVPCNKVEMQKQWIAKLYLHNTPHCITAYLGAYEKLTYVHEAMEIPEISEIVNGTMNEMLQALKLGFDIPHSFLDWYAAKEISRFSSSLLYDPISRVAREPLRKLELDGRLIGAAQLCLSLGIVPQNILLGIVSAILFENTSDPDHHISFMGRSLSHQMFLTHILSLRKGEALEMVLSRQLESLTSKLKSLVHSMSEFKNAA